MSGAEVAQATGTGTASRMDGLDTGAMWKLVYQELRQLAGRKMARLEPGQTLQPTELVHEAYLRLADRGQLRWQNRAHFFAAAARAMRNILVDRFRARSRIKRGGDRARLSISRVVVACDERPLDLLALDSALSRLERYDARMSEIVTLRFFVGLTVAETAEILGVSRATVERDWTYARAWLYRELCR